MMRELHEARRQDYLRFKDVPVEEAMVIRRKELLEKLARDGWTLVEVKPGIMRLQRIRKSKSKKTSNTIRKTTSRAKK